VFERRLYHHIDWALVIAILALCTLGVVMINSTTADPTRSMSRMYLTQIYAIVLGLGAMVFMLTLDYRTFTDKSHLIYIGLCALLLYVLFFGMVQMGARRWIPLKVFNLQPSEFAKLGVALVLAKFFGENRGTPGQGSAGVVPRAWRARQLHLPGGLQHHHVGRTGARQRADASAHELRRVVDDRDPGRLRAGAERPHAQVHELTREAHSVQLSALG
jgi:hypothetical protein